ncbi:MAG: hypothetical protein QE280_02710 [Caulobacter sp.]|nr:hypothetical protein [Caulobacter sp.]
MTGFPSGKATEQVKAPLNLAPRGRMFIGWSPPDSGTRRGLLLAGLGMAGAGTAAAFAAGPLGFMPGSGRWDPTAVRTWTGQLIVDPYPTLIWRNKAGEDQTALLGCPDKCGVRAEVERFANQSVTVRGSLIERSGLKMIAGTLEPGWISRGQAPAVAPPKALPLGAVELQGELMDAKCWLGAMRPGEGLTHRSCAILCVRMGLPLLFVAGPPGGRRRAFVAVDERGKPFDEAILPFVADPVRLSGQALSWRGWPRLSFPVQALKRL